MSTPTFASSMAPVGILVHYAEVALKGGNRQLFVDRLRNNMQETLSGLDVQNIQNYSGRILIFAKPQGDLQPMLERLRWVPGIAWFAPTYRAKLDMQDMKAVSLAAVQGLSYASFRIRARRTFKEMPFSSQEVDREVGAHLVHHKPAKVQLKNPELTVGIEMLPSGVFVHTAKIPGLGGLPVGSGGRLTCLLSGGIDSPVAASRMQRRGCRLSFVHFHSSPFQSRASQDKAHELAEVLVRYQGHANLYMVPFGQLQREIVAQVPAPLRVVLYRRFMLRLAASVAKRERAQALVTGESLGQVASQTLDNLSVINAASPLLVLRPLVGCDKAEIIAAAEALHTFTISTQPDEDCCQLFMPKRAETRARLDDVELAESTLDIDALCRDALDRSERLHISAPWWQTKGRQAESQTA